jgi:hypothetical protein
MGSHSPTEYPSLPRYWLRDVLSSHRFHGSCYEYQIDNDRPLIWGPLVSGIYGFQ